MRSIALSMRLDRDAIATCIFKSELNAHLRRVATCDYDSEPFFCRRIFPIENPIYLHFLRHIPPHSATHESHLYLKHARRAFIIYCAFCIKAHDDVTFSPGREC
jgi:hypothetical protein